jgi:hypothetical protein
MFKITKNAVYDERCEWFVKNKTKKWLMSTKKIKADMELERTI